MKESKDLDALFNSEIMRFSIYFEIIKKNTGNGSFTEIINRLLWELATICVKTKNKHLRIMIKLQSKFEIYTNVMNYF